MRDRGEMLRIDTPELEECDALFFYRNLTFGEGLVLLKHFDLTSGELDFDGLPDILLKLARKEDGARAFPAAHREKILQWDFPVAIRIVEQMAPIFESVTAGAKKI